MPIVLILACSGESDEDTGESPSGDTAGDTAETDTIPITATFTDGVSGSPIVGAEICTVVPENDDPCETTDGVGAIQWQQVSLAFSNVLNRMTHPDYMTTLYAGRYDQGVHDGWMAALETSDSILIDYWAFQTSSVEAYLSTGDAVNEEGHGIVGYWLLGADGSAVNGAVITVENAAGEAVGDVLYGAGMTNTIDTDLTATSIAGNVHHRQYSTG